MKLRTFTMGGIHPPENKMAAGVPIQVVPLPNEIIVPLSQHLGKPATALLEKGAAVKVGTLIGRADGFISANIHSPVSGTITKIDEVIDVNGYPKLAYYIKVEGDEWESSIDRSPDLKREISLTKEEIVKKIHEMGVVGKGGACFPTNVKYTIPEGKKAEYLIINGVECEPYLSVDDRLMVEHSHEICVGISILMRTINVEEALIGVEANKPEAIKVLGEAARNYKGIFVVPLEVKYPQGAEKQLIKALTNREIPSGKLPIDVGCVVNNVGTAFAIYEAVQKNKPMIERRTTVAGKSLKTPGNFLVRIGTPIRNLIELCGGVPEGTGKLVVGGPMMGKSGVTIEAPVTKGTSGIVFFTEEESKRRIPTTCIRCGMCIDVCPMGLEPYLLESLVRNKLYSDAKERHVLDCIECGSCHYICPSARPLIDYLRNGKTEATKLARK